MGNRWVTKSLGDIASLQRGHDLPSQDRSIGSIPIMGSAGLTGFHNEVKAKGPGVILGRSGSSMGEAHFIETDYWPLNTALYVVDFHDNIPRFIYYLFKTIDFKKYNSGSAQPSLDRNQVHPMVLDIPDTRGQSAIAHILGTLDDKIELLRSMNETLEAMARALFKSWFIDFDPVRKKAEGQPTGLPPEIDALFPDSFEDSELGEIPKGWKVLPFLSQIELIGGGTPKTSMKEYWEGDIPWYSVVDSPRPQDIFVIDTEKHITQEAIDNSSTRILPAGTTIISARGTVGNLALTATPMCMNQSCYGVRSTIPSGDTYTYFALKNIVQSLKGMAHGSVFDTITRSTFDSATACVPSPSLIQAYGEKTDPILSQVRCNLYEIKSLTLGRDTLLPRLISGDLELSDKDITKIMEPAK